MERLSELLGFEARYLVYPLLAVMVASLVRLVIHRYLKKWVLKTETDIDDKIVRYLETAVLPLLLIAVLYLVSNILPLSERVIYWIKHGLIILALILLLVFVAKVTLLILDSLATRHPSWHHYLQLLRNLSVVLCALIGLALSLKILALDLSDAGVRFVRIIGIVVGAYVVLKMVRLAVTRMQSLVSQRDRTHLTEAERRANTLGRIINSVALVLMVGVAVMMILSELGMDITPMITGAGIVGLAVGFGAQNLVRDIISGFFLILEDQIRVGDVAVINGTGGLVEAMNLRTTVLRDLEGTVHIFPNGEIKQVSNRTKEWSRYVIDVGVAYKEDVDYVMDVLRHIGTDLVNDENFNPLILEPLEILGVDDLGESQVTIKIAIKTLPLKQWIVGRELRRRIKKTFDEKGIEIPFPHVSVYFGEASRPFALLLERSSAEQKTRASRDGSADVQEQI
jgi:small conductance mechanosensitive channel